MSELMDKGVPVERYGSHSRPVTDKLSLLKEYKLTICPENSIGDGYITEKPMHGYLSGCTSLYRSGINTGPLDFMGSGLFLMPAGSSQDNLRNVCERARALLQLRSVRCKPLLDEASYKVFFDQLVLRLRQSLGWMV